MHSTGPDVGVGLDFHGRVKLPMAKKLMASWNVFVCLFVFNLIVVARRVRRSSNAPACFYAVF